MGWASRYIDQLKEGKTVSFRPKGNSMTPHIKSGELVTIGPPGNIQAGDIVLCRVGGKEYLHFVRVIKTSAKDGTSYLIGNARGYINGWTTQIFGKKI